MDRGDGHVLREDCKRAPALTRGRSAAGRSWPPGRMSFLGQVADTWQALIDLIIRPPRHEYSVQRELGPQRLVVRGGLVIREDIEVHAAAAACPALRTPYAAAAPGQQCELVRASMCALLSES